MHDDNGGDADKEVQKPDFIPLFEALNVSRSDRNFQSSWIHDQESLAASVTGLDMIIEVSLNITNNLD